MKLLFLLLSLVFNPLSAQGLQEKLDARAAQSSKKTKNDPKMAEIRMKMKKANEDLANSGIMKKAVGVGVKVPDFRVGKNMLSSYYKKHPIVIKFYRGHWCPYCMIELQEYQRLLPEIKKRNGRIIGLVPDTKEYILKTKRKFNITFPIFSDKDNNVAKKFGLAFKVSDEIVDIYKGFDIKLKESQGNSNNELPMPGTYVVDTEGIIRYAFFDANYVKRADPQEVLKILSRLQ